jgi:hypothetical protein
MVAKPRLLLQTAASQFAGAANTRSFAGSKLLQLINDAMLEGGRPRRSAARGWRLAEERIFPGSRFGGKGRRGNLIK